MKKDNRNRLVTPQTELSKKISILETEIVQNAQVFFCNAASYQDSSPFSAIFEVWDVDDALTTDKSTGQKSIAVLCQWGDDSIENHVLHIDIADALLHAGEGYSGQVVRRIDWST